MRGTLPIWFAFYLLVRVPVAQADTREDTADFAEVVIPITAAKIFPSLKLTPSANIRPQLELAGSFGTGFCLDPECRFVATNYHVAVAAQTSRLQGQKIIQRYFATGPDDHHATANTLSAGNVLAFAASRDLAVFEMNRPLRKHHGIGFSLDELEQGQQVDIYGYPLAVSPIRTLTRIPAKFTGRSNLGLLGFDYEFESQMQGGASGGIVVDRQTRKIVGIVCGTSGKTAVAVPVSALVELVKTIDLYLAEKIFPTSRDLPSSTDDLYPEFVPSHSAMLEFRAEEPEMVRRLREKAQQLADSIRNFIAVQTFAWGKGDKNPYAESEYEVRIIDGQQRFREYPNGKKELSAVPFPEGITAAAEWSELPTMVAKQLHLKVEQAADAMVNRRQVKVFRYYASQEDKLCPFGVIWDFGFFEVTRGPFNLACYGEVWTDQDLNIIRISQTLKFVKPLADGWRGRRAVVTYGWLTKENQAPRLVPQTIYVEGWRKSQMYWCRGYFANYRVFEVGARLMTD